MRTTPIVPDSNGNRYAEEGLDVCGCGCKYWEHDCCIDCATPVTMRKRRLVTGGPTGRDRWDPAAGTLRATMYGGVHYGTPGRPNANPILALMRDDDIGHDPWGTAMAWTFGVCDYLYHVALAEVPDGVGYMPAATARGEGFDDEAYPDAFIAEAALDTYTLTKAAIILDRYIGWCVAAGKDY